MKIMPMAVRFIAEDFKNGYGVLGDRKVNDSLVQLIDVRALVDEIPKPLTVNNAPEAPPYLYHVLNVQWRLSLRLLTASDADINQYFAPLNKRKLGRWTASAFDYVSWESNWSYDAEISPKFVFSKAYNNFEEVPEDEACSEPQDGNPEFVVPGFNPSPWGGSGILNYAGVGYKLNATEKIADSVLIYAEPPVLAYRWGVTYEFMFYAYTQEDADAAGFDGVNVYII